MRRLADALPTLRETPSGTAVPPSSPPATGERFDPATVIRAFATRRATALPRPSESARSARDGDRVGGKAVGEIVGGGTETRAGETGRSSPDAPAGAQSPRTEPAAARPIRVARPERASPAEAARARLAELAARSRRPVSGEPSPAQAAAPPPRSHAPAPIPLLDAPPEPAEDKVATAVAAALATAEEEKARAVAAARDEERAAAERRLAEARAAWVEEQAEALASRLGDAFETLHARLSDAFGKALAPIADGIVRDRAVRRFASVLDDLAGDGARRPAITVRGPDDLVQALKRIMGARPAIAFERADTAELVVTLSDTRVETMISVWADDLAKALGQTE